MSVRNRPSDLPVWADAGDKVQPTDNEVTTGFVTTNVPPSRQRFNWTFNWLFNAVRYLLQRGLPEWSATETYPVKAIIMYSGVAYRSLTANNNRQPDTSTSDWEVWGFSAADLATILGAYVKTSDLPTVLNPYAKLVDLASTALNKGAGLIGFKQAGTGAVDRTSLDKMQESVTALDWGHVVNPATTTYPYNPDIPVDVLRGSEAEKFALTLAKVLNYTDTPNFKLSARAFRAFASGTVHITIVGDSITAGADNWRSNTYVTLLQTKLRQTFPWVKFTFSNLAIGGMSAATLNSDSYVGAADRGSFVISQNFWFPRSNGGVNTNDTLAPTGYALLDEDSWPMGSVAGKTWKQHVVDSTPDVVVWAFGMNDGTDYDGFLSNYNAFQTFVGSQMAGVEPWFILVSCFLADKIPPNGQPHAAWQLPAQCMADQLKYLAKRDSYGHIDANAVFNMLRDGIRHDYAPYHHEFNWRYAADSAAWTYGDGFAFNSGSNYASGTGMATRRIATRDIDFSATFQVASFSGVYFVGRIMYRGTSETPGALTGYSADLVLNASSQIATIMVYYKATLIHTLDYDQGAIPPVGHTVAFKVKCYGDRHEIWLADLLLLEFNDVRSFYRGPVQVGIPQGSGSAQSLGLSYAGLNVETPTHVDRKWLLGTPIYDGGGNFVTYGDFITNPDSLGGNVVNHPTAWGHNTFYGFGVMRFVEELKRRLNEPLNLISQSGTAFTVTAAANTPQKVTTIAPITVALRTTTKLEVEICASYSIGSQTSFCQLGLFVNDGWSQSSYLPTSTALGADMKMVTLRFQLQFTAGVYRLELGAVRNTTGETFRIGEAGTVYSLAVKESY